MLLPFQFKTMSTSLAWLWLGPHVPIQEPFSGCPSCAAAGPETGQAREREDAQQHLLPHFRRRRKMARHHLAIEPSCCSP